MGYEVSKSKEQKVKILWEDTKFEKKNLPLILKLLSNDKTKWVTFKKISGLIYNNILL